MKWFRDFKLLVWKNYTLIKWHWLVIITELIMTLLFPLLLVLFRYIISQRNVQSYHYPSLPVDKLPSFLEHFFENNTWELVYIPSSSEIVKTVVEDAYKALGTDMKVTGFSSENAFEDYIKHSGNSSNVLAAIVFNHDFHDGKDILPLQANYSLRFSKTARNLWYFWKRTVIEEEKTDWHTNLLFPVFPESGPRNPEFDDGGAPGYFAEGFLAVQHAVDKAIIQYHARNIATDLFNTTSVFVKRFPFPPTSDDNFHTILAIFLPLTILFIFSLIILNMIHFVVLEKENRLKEYLRIMGISNLLLWSSYFFTYFTFLLFIIIMLTIILAKKITYLPIIHYTEGSLVFFFLMCSAIVSIFFSFMISTFFNKANTAAAIGGFLYFITYLPYPFIHSYYGVMTLSKKLFSCLLSNVAVLLGIQVLIASEVTKKGIHWSTLMRPVTMNDDLTLGHILGMLIFDSFFYAFITWYVEAVFPGKYGIPQSWNFFLLNSYWFGTSKSTAETDIELTNPFENPYIEEDPLGLEAGIQIKHLSKVFIVNHVKKYAVNDLTMNFYEGQITVLLGHNGAGKTTTLSMLTGMYPPTSGEAYICGYEISKAMVQIRKSMGFCPQYDILFDHMTVADHLYFYSQLKGLTLKECHKEVGQTLKFFSLEEKHNDFSYSLTASMKRKLSISIALVGDSKVIILDEPTSRMDPVTRSITWDLLQQLKHGHTIVLTTHNMNEADVLGDRIAIMAKGELQCCGSSFFLKQKYGAGYHMVIAKELHCDAQEITQVVLQYIPNATLESEFGAELSFVLPKESTNRFEALFTELENRKKDLGIASFGASVTTMEEVFLRVGKLADDQMDLQAMEPLSLWYENEEITRKESIARKHHLSKKNWFKKFVSTNVLNTSAQMANTGCKLYYQQFHAMFNKRALYCWRNWKMTLIHILAPLVFTSLVLSSFSSLISQDSPVLKLDLSIYDKTIVPFSVSGNTSLIKKVSEYLNIMLKSKGQHPKLVTGNLEDFLVESKICIERCIVAISLEVIDNKLIATALFNNEAYHSAAIATAVLDNILFMLLSGPNASIMVANKPQPVSAFSNINTIFLDNFNGYEIAISLSFGLSTLVSTFAIQTVSERVNKVKHIQFVAGVYVIIFWLSALIWDLFNFFIPCLLLLVVFIVYNIEAFYGHFMDILMIVMLYGWSVIPLMYLMSFFFLRSAAAYTKLVIFNLFSGWTSFLLAFFVRFKALNLGTYAEIVNSLFLVLPGYNLVMAISGFHEFIRNKKFCDLLVTTTEDCSQYSKYIYKMSQRGIGTFLIAMAVLGFVFLFVLLFIETYSWEIRLYFHRFLHKTYRMRNPKLKMEFAPTTFPEDEDVAKEREKVLACPEDMISSLNSLLVIRKLTKIYYRSKVPFVAVDKLSLTVQKGECLGLLGFSGAGKTSTLKMLAGNETITEGDAFFENHSICKNITEVRKIIGYCPQADALLDHMTGREMLMMYARLRGIPESYIQQYVDRLLQMLLMEFHSDKLTKTYSGGTKQKLRNAIALVGFPSVIFLDEPSTGMDPVARHLLWDMITQTRESGKAIVLSSHSMEECEMLCTRLAIMANGKLQCLGSPQYLKNKFSKGYTLVAKIKRDNIETALQYFKGYITVTFPGSTMIQEHQGMVQYHIPSENLSWAKVFGMLEDIKDEYNLEDYSICQTTLEQVFMSFANLEEKEE
ncbi:phospholipid-transporting ATPase ABCA3-like [Notamacropus eugenii]|uniref:phospholipid-transporting ATPase ABCA3-like n=1 Tax=Notamacropus eugenii TaxID=9315 RepID=UPI003B675B32